MAEWAGTELAPGPRRTDDELFDYIRETHNTVYHPACTVRMGAPDDPDAPLDPQLRVKGVTGLRVADGSVMPFLPAVNPCITTMMIGEKCADMMRSDCSAHTYGLRGGLPSPALSGSGARGSPSGPATFRPLSPTFPLVLGESQSSLPRGRSGRTPSLAP